MNRRRNLIILGAGLALIIIIGIISAARPKADAVTVSVTKIAPTHFQTRLPETGQIQRPQTETLAALVPGNIDQIFVKPGDRVAAGQLLVSLSNPQLASNAASARATYLAATGRASTAVQASEVLPSQNQSALVQAEFNLEQTKFSLNQAITDEKNGAQSGLGYGGNTAAEQRVAADASVATADSNLHEALRIYTANKDLYANRAISKDALDQSQVKYEQAKIADDQAKQTRTSTYQQLSQNVPVLADRVRANRDAVRQAEAALQAARLTASQNKTGDVQAARSDAAARLADMNYADDQVARLQIKAPYAGIVQTVATETGDSLRTLQPGDTVSVGQAVVSVAAIGGFIVRARVDEQDIANVRMGQKAKISGEDLGTKSLTGHIVAIGAVAVKSDDPSNTSRQIITTIALDGALPYLRDGMTVDVDLITTDLANVIAVSNDAIRRDPAGKPYVFRVGADKKAVKTPITLGAANETMTIVKSGLKPGDTIVTDRSPAVAEKSIITPAPSPSPQASPAVS